MPLLAEQWQRKLQELLAATEKDLLPIVTATQRAKEPLRGAVAISACGWARSSTTFSR